MTEHDDDRKVCDVCGVMVVYPPDGQGHDGDCLVDQLAEARRTIEERDAELVKLRGLCAILNRDGGQRQDEVGTESAAQDAVETWALVWRERDKALAELAATQGTLRALKVQLTATRDEANGYHAERDAAWEMLRNLQAKAQGTEQTTVEWCAWCLVCDEWFGGATEAEALAERAEGCDCFPAVPNVDTYGIAKLERDLQAERDAHAETRLKLATVRACLHNADTQAKRAEEAEQECVDLRREVVAVRERYDALAASLERVREAGWSCLVEQDNHRWVFVADLTMGWIHAKDLHAALVATADPAAVLRERDARVEKVREVWRGILEVWPRAQLEVRFYEPRENDLRPLAVQDGEYRTAGDLTEALKALLDEAGT